MSLLNKFKHCYNYFEVHFKMARAINRFKFKLFSNVTNVNINYYKNVMYYKYTSTNLKLFARMKTLFSNEICEFFHKMN